MYRWTEQVLRAVRSGETEGQFHKVPRPRDGRPVPILQELPASSEGLCRYAGFHRLGRSVAPAFSRPGMTTPAPPIK